MISHLRITTPLLFFLEPEQYLGPIIDEAALKASKGDEGNIDSNLIIMKKTELLNQAVGVDISKDHFSSCHGVLKPSLDKDFIQCQDLTNDKIGYAKLDKWIKKVQLNKERPVIVLEATGVYHEGLTHYFHKKGYVVCVMQSGRVKRYAQSLIQRSKTDMLDSKMLSMLGCERKLTPWTPPRKTLVELRFLSRERAALLKERTVEKNRNHANEIAEFTNKKSITRYNRRMKLLNDQITEVEKDMLTLTETDKELKECIPYLVSIPGISFISAITVVAETFGFSLVQNAKQLTSMSGFDVVHRESGTYKGQAKISKKGNKHIRSILYMPAMTAGRINPTLAPFYNRLKSKKTKPMIAIVAVQRKLLVLMYSLWKNKEFYDLEHEQKKAAKNKSLAAQDNFKVELEIS